MAATPEQYLERVLETISLASRYVSASGIEQVQHLVSHGEPAEGMRSLAWIIVSERRRVPMDLIRSVRALAAGLVDDKFMPENLDSFGVDEPV
jgi:hypothetical protein